MKKNISVTLIAALLALIPATAGAENYVTGGFEAFGHVVTGIGFEKFSNNPVTEWTNDGTFPGVIGSYIPNVAAGTLPSPGQDNFMFYVDDAELDIVKTFGKNIGIRADLEFGRLSSGSFFDFNMQQAYLTANIPMGNGLEFTIGRFWGPAGFEGNDAFDNEIISWSILTRANLYPYMYTGIKARYEFNDNLALSLVVSNDNVSDTTATMDDVPSFTAHLRINWGEEDHENTVGITPFFGPESGDNTHFSYGMDVDWYVYLTESLSIGGEGLFRRDNGFGGPNSEYAAGIFEIYYDLTEAVYGVIRYSYCRQFDVSNGVLNLTGDKQQIHEASLGGGWWFADNAGLKAEARFDYIAPDDNANQWNVGASLAFMYGF